VDKIEILSPADSMTRLREFIDEDQIPAQYGGTGPDLYFPNIDSEFLWVGRNSEVTKNFLVPAGKAVIVDSYVGEGALECTVSSLKFDGQEKPAEVEKKEERRSSWLGGGKEKASPAVVHKDAVVHVDKRNIAAPDEGASERYRHVIAFPAGESHLVTATWRNANKMSQRPLVYAFTAVDPADVGPTPPTPPRLGHTQSEGKRQAAAAAHKEE